MNKFGLAILAVPVAGLGVLVWNMLVPAPQTHSMTPPDTSALQQGAPIAEVSLPATLSENARIGRRAFEAKCAVCHGQNAAGQNGVAPPLVHPTYRPGHHADAAFLIAARNGVRAHHWKFGNMPPVEGITAGDVRMITRYIRELQQANGIE
ncbi:c-type cytochrome [Sedimentitalea nanhaiensis]|uniref:Cytochrome C oxidase, cbb3-type, subunit III n=1 Tax=Sedimentitalea nanhaiensis TaxID=999627 RepID=A0A1I7DSM5_9RHOB|nr:cytochrome c [Sedimentitalea nanhaiensis]SFU14649.1 Cytochrome C oxidase, cbb3-type, subunit III [Sedimentitalea nanhaiensis]